MKVRYLGHAAFTFSHDAHTLIIDPFLSGNPRAPLKPADVAAQYVLVSHAHPDHFGDAIEIARANNATVVSNFEIGTYCQSLGVAAHTMHIGGSHRFPFGTVKLTIAHHASTIPTDSGLLTLGNPCGMLVSMGGRTIYHTGDTGLFYDMKLIGEMNPVDLALVPIGDNYTMGVADAVKAVELIRPRAAVPMHYGTFDLIAASPEEFVSKVEKLGVASKVLEPGAEMEI
ncbi:MAG: metal-dependent hydrolase [bacterium]